jgi:hypothetical protein
MISVQQIDDSMIEDGRQAVPNSTLLSGVPSRGGGDEDGTLADVLQRKNRLLIKSRNNSTDIRNGAGR